MSATIAFFLLITALISEIIFLVRDRRSSDPVSHFILIPVLLLLIITTVTRSLSIEFLAVTSTYEALLLLCEALILLLVIYRFRAKERTLKPVMLGGTLIALMFLALASSPIIPDAVKPPVPALQSSWLILHILFSFFGEAFFAVGFVAALLYLFGKFPKERKDSLDRLIYQSILVGYALFSVGGLVFGAVWAYNAWGRYWGWDPKETSAFITFLLYTLYLHLRLVRQFRGKVSALLAAAGFLTAVFSFLAINYLIPGLHSY